MAKRALVPKSKEKTDTEQGNSSATNELTAAAESWIDEAAVKGPGRPALGEDKRKKHISLFFDPQLLQRVDDRAAKMGMTRSAFISMSVYRALEAQT